MHRIPNDWNIIVVDSSDLTLIVLPRFFSILPNPDKHNLMAIVSKSSTCDMGKVISASDISTQISKDFGYGNLDFLKNP